MSFTNYSELKAAIRTWSTRTDISDDQIDEFIDIAEAVMYSNSEETLKTRDGETRATASTSTTSRYLALPSGFLEMRQLKIILDDSFPDVIYQPPEVLFIFDRAGLPKHFTITNQIELDRTSDIAYTIEMNYHATFTALSSSSTTNFVLTNHPNIYLFGSRWVLSLRYKLHEEALMYWGLFIDAIKGANKRYRQGRYGPSPYMRIEGDTP